MQWNACSLSAHAAELRHFIHEVKNKPHIICIQETFLKRNQKFNLEGYEIVKKDREDGRAGGGE